MMALTITVPAVASMTFALARAAAVDLLVRGTDRHADAVAHFAVHLDRPAWLGVPRIIALWPDARRAFQSACGCLAMRRVSRNFEKASIRGTDPI
jgi:hypothetical protein